MEDESAGRGASEAAEVLENFFPTRQGVALRKGARRVGWTGERQEILVPAIQARQINVDFYDTIYYGMGEAGLRVSLWPEYFSAEVPNSGATFRRGIATANPNVSILELTGIEDESVWTGAAPSNANIAAYIDGSLQSVGVLLNDPPRVFSNGHLTPAVTRTSYGSDPARPIVSLFSRDVATPTLFAGVAESAPNAADGYVAAASGDMSASPAIAGLKGGDWSTTHISTSAGDYIVGVNGRDQGFVGDGSSFGRYWHAANPTGAAHEMHGVDTAKLSRVWNYKERLFFIEKDSTSAWYLPPKVFRDTDSAPATELPLGAVFERGGKLLFGTTFSFDSGDGLDDRCVFVTSRGEVAVFGGLHPGASDWLLEGRYTIAEPCGANAWFRVGGDVAICTRDGIVSLMEAARGDRIAAASTALSRPIARTWRRAVAEGGFPYNATLWREGAALYVPVAPSGPDSRVLVMNADTGAWCFYKGWDMRCSAASGDRLFFGTADGIVCEAEAGGVDEGAGAVGYSGLCVPKFRHFGEPNRKMLSRISVTRRASAGVYDAIGLADEDVGPATDGTLSPSPLHASNDARTSWGTASGSATWGEGSARAAKWGSGDREASATTEEEWRSARAVGRSLSAAVAVQSNTQQAPVFEILALQMRYEIGQAM